MVQGISASAMSLTRSLTHIVAVLLVCAATGHVHPERAKQISEIQNTPGVLWQAAAHARFASQPPGASRDMMGLKGDQEKIISDMLEQGKIMVDDSFNSDAQIPDDFDSETNWPDCAKVIGDIRDQGNCGCCWAFSVAEAGSDRMCIATKAKMMVPLSAQDVCFGPVSIMSQGCDGGNIMTPWAYLTKTTKMGGKGAVTGGQYQGTGPFGKGLCSDFSLPHCHHHGPQGSDPYPAEGQPGCPKGKSPPSPKACDADAKAPHNDFASDRYYFEGDIVVSEGDDAIQKAIMAGGPLSTSFVVYSDFENYAGGIYHYVSGEQLGAHAVKIVGWGVENETKYWKIANSWNPYWGEKGYFRMKRGDNVLIANQAIGSAPDGKWTRTGDSSVVV